MTALRDDLQRIVAEDKDHGPFVSIFMPLDPDADSMKDNTAQFNDLLAQAKKQFDDLFPTKEWNAYDQRLRMIGEHITMDYAQSRGLAIIAGDKDVYQYYLATHVDPLAVVSNNLYILPIIDATEFQPNYNILQIDRDSFRMFNVEDGLISEKPMPTGAPVSAKKALGDEVIGGDEKIRMHEHGRYSEYRGYDVKDESEQADERNYFEVVDEYVTKHVSLRDHLPVVLMAVSEDEGEFRKISHNPYLSKDLVISKVPPIFNHKTLEDATDKINQEMIKIAQSDIADQIDTAKSAKKFVGETQDVINATIEGRVATLIIAKGAKLAGSIAINATVDTTSAAAKQNNLLNDLAATTMSYGGRVYIVDPAQLDGQPVIALLKGNH